MTTRSLAFMDESGVLGGAAQRFFALGLMKTTHTGPLSDAAHRILDRAISSVPGGAQGFEFKFNSVTTNSLPFHLELIDAFFSQPDHYFCAFVLDKQRPGVNWQGYFESVWDAYLSYAKLVVRQNIDPDEEVCVIADYLGKPKKSPRYFESEVAACTGRKGPNQGRVFNACMLDSCSSLPIQVVDVILGGVRHAFLADREPQVTRDVNKDVISRRIRERVAVPTLARNLTKAAPRYFSVWELAP
ncbi:MAG: DUF3800 domain-containing protein [Actinobacteria bacterium]|nr:DUF3800 domain-containing protein [Actinomycetota bacterium]